MKQKGSRDHSEFHLRWNFSFLKQLKQALQINRRSRKKKMVALNVAEAVNQSDPYLLVRASGGYGDIDGLHLPFPDHRSLAWKLQLMA